MPVGRSPPPTRRPAAAFSPPAPSTSFTPLPPSRSQRATIKGQSGQVFKFLRRHSGQSDQTRLIVSMAKRPWLFTLDTSPLVLIIWATSLKSNHTYSLFADGHLIEGPVLILFLCLKSKLRIIPCVVFYLCEAEKLDRILFLLLSPQLSHSSYRTGDSLESRKTVWQL